MKIDRLICSILLVFSIQFNTKSQPSVGLKLVHETYLQEIKSDIKLPDLASSNILKLFKTKEKVTCVTSNGIYSFQNNSWTGKPNHSVWETATLDKKNEIWLASKNFIQNGDSTVLLKLPENSQNDTISCLAWENEKVLHVGTNNGLLTYDGSWHSVSIAAGSRVHAIAADQKGDLWVATNNGLLLRIAAGWFNMDAHLMAKGLKRQYFALETTAKNDVVFGGLFALGCIAKDGDHWLLRGADGLPYGPITSIHSFNKTIWLGTDKGAIKKDSTWHYYNGKRWLPNNKINDILPLDEHTVWIATPSGISQIKQTPMTLEQKASVFEERISLRHNRYGLISQSLLTTPGDLSTSKKTTNDNDGLWTAIYLAAECFRYAVTKDPEAKKNAINSYEALERLETATGISGLPGRSFAAASDTVIQSRSPYPKKWHPSADGKWQWLDDASSDELAGHLFAIPLFYDLVADAPTKKRIKGLVDREMTHIITNNFQFIDFDGKPTQWAIWNPDSLNNVPGRWYERGTNSLQILSFLKVAVYITGDQKFEKAYQMLIQKHHYAENTLEAKRAVPYENSHSDDILTYLPYYSLFAYSKDTKHLPTYTTSIQRAWNAAKPDRTPLWNIIASVALKKDCDIAIAKEELQLIPMDMITWTMDNSHRWDLQADQLIDRSRKAQATRIIPTPEAGIVKANSNPREFIIGSNGTHEDDGAYFLLPYWMGRYHGYFQK
ncbi:MAG: transcriptional regulator [Bacteroidia bacterium]|nr:transcriptional regulator [Bacteroidia bacterium]